MNLEKTQFEIPFQKAKIDSFTLLIPIENVQIISSTFTQKYTLLFDETSEIEDNENFYKNYIKTENKDSGTFLKYKKINRLWVGVNRQFIQIMITSKQLRNTYFDGININNIECVFNQIIEDNIIFLEYDEFLKAYITDIDICKDYRIDLDGFKDLKKILLENVLESKKSVVYSKRINSKESFGVQYNERSKATPTKPFAKLYFKTNEILNEKNKDFVEANLRDYLKIILSGIGRFEVTIKDSKHKKHLGIENIKTLIDLLQLDEVFLNNLHKKIFNEYYEQNIVEKVKPKERMSTQKLISLGLLKRIVNDNKNITRSELIRIAQSECENKKQRYSVKNEVEVLIDELIELSSKREKIEANNLKFENRNNILKDLGLFE